MANTSILAAFERMWFHVVTKLGGKSDIDHIHDEMYYTEEEIDLKLSEVNTSITNIKNGTTTVKNAENADVATLAINAEKDGNGNVIVSTYETKSDAETKLDNAIAYIDQGLNEKANATHIHAISDITNLQEKLDALESLDGKASVQLITWEAND